MPGTPRDGGKGASSKLQTLQTDDNTTEHTENGGEGEDRRENGENVENQRESYGPGPARPALALPEARQLTQTDKLNKRLLQSLLERMNKSDGKFDRFMDKKDEDDEERSSEF